MGDNRWHDLQKCFVSHEERYCLQSSEGGHPQNPVYVLLRKLGAHRMSEMAQRMTPLEI